MTESVKYRLERGMDLDIQGQRLSVIGQTDVGYETYSKESGEVSIVPFVTFNTELKAGRLSLFGSEGGTLQALSASVGGHRSIATMNASQRKKAQFAFALCKGIDIVRSVLLDTHGSKAARMTIKQLNDPDIRREICKESEPYFDEPISGAGLRGGRPQFVWLIPEGQTLKKGLKIFDALRDDDQRLLALAPKENLKGNRTQRLCSNVYRLLHEVVINDTLDLRDKGISNAHRILSDKINIENIERRRNELPSLICPSQKTLKNYVDRVFTPLDQAIATQGYREARNSHSAGRADIRALTVGEICEMDECKLSIITMLKENGIWFQQSKEWKKAVREADAIIKKRLTLLVMIDYATRMPLAWVLSDQPREVASLQLLGWGTVS